MERTISFETKIMSGWPEVLYFSMLMLMLARHVWSGASGWLLGVTAVMMGLIAVAMVTAVKHLSQRRNHPLIIHDEYVIAGNVTYFPQDIERIVVQGYFRPHLRIRPPGRDWLRRRQWFRITQDEDQGIRELRLWAKGHGVRMN